MLFRPNLKRFGNKIPINVNIPSNFRKFLICSRCSEKYSSLFILFSSLFNLYSSLIFVSGWQRPSRCFLKKVCEACRPTPLKYYY